MAGTLCRRLGPGRLPYASRRDAGGGIAMGATALLAIAVWFGGAAVLFGTGVVTGASAGHLAGFTLGMSVFVAPLSVPTAVVVGIALWRYVHPGGPRPFLGGVLGACTAVVSVAGGALGIGFVVGLSNVADGTMGLLEAVQFVLGTTMLAVPFAIAFGGWLVVPLGAFGGWYHERAKRAG
ncbi:hypothetical protein [Natrarchaeobaculum aegyptiacum]|uniref:Uncharacterized protein n=1 Tax=Natrarchaeobaculum aegyptiacum TaxID=745377 RepID=A0A2Z2I163_9EURY|nr:hypothetical protein [Natrarchaeobaculum aegyptiacum]ARS90098.1 hypothetical protein B1756_10405 [Natrarchaeobaculum aegyptiacum]